MPARRQTERPQAPPRGQQGLSALRREEEGGPEIDKQVDTAGGLDLVQGGSPGEEIHGGREVAPREGGLAGRSQLLACASPQRPCAAVCNAQLRPTATGLLEVVADDLVVRTSAVLEPVGESLVQAGPSLLGNSVVGRIAREDVTERESILAHQARALREDQPPPYEPLKERTDLRGGRGERQQRVAPELLSDDRRAFEQRPFLGLQPVKPGREERLDRARDHELFSVLRSQG